MQSAYIPFGQNVLVDINIPHIYAIIIEGGSLIFSDDSDLEIGANYIIANGGKI